MKTCFENLVGLSRLECECFEVDESIKDSTQGLWLDEHEGVDLQLIQNALKCGDELATNFEKIYSNGLNFLESDLQVEISNQYKQKHKAYIGRIGEKKYSQTISTSNLVGLKLNTKHIVGASIIVKNLTMYFANSGTVTIQVYKNDELLDDEYEIIVESGATLHELPIPLILPIVENGIKNDYYFVYTPSSLQPYNNKTSCGCSGIESVRSKFLKAEGVIGASFEDLDVNSTYTYGISIDVVISCSIDNLICDFMLDTVFERRFAMALWYKMGVLTIEALFASREINFDTFSDREYLYGRKNKFGKAYRDLVLWLSENTSINQSDCFICDSTKVMNMGKIVI